MNTERRVREEKVLRMRPRATAARAASPRPPVEVPAPPAELEPQTPVEMPVPLPAAQPETAPEMPPPVPEIPPPAEPELISS